MKKLLLIITLTTILHNTAIAQRVVKGQSAIAISFIALDGINLACNNLSLGISFEYNKFTRAGNWIGLLEYTSSRSPYDNNSYIPYSCLNMQGGYSFRIASNYRRSIIFNAGITALLGYEIVNNSSKEFNNGILVDQTSKFLYGCTPFLNLDFFLTRKGAISFSVKERLAFGSDVTTNHTLFTLGLKYLIN